MVTPITACRVCGSSRLEPVLDLGTQALTGVFPRTKDAPITSGPLQLLKCREEDGSCGLVQLAHTYDLEELYGETYGYRSGLNASMVRHLRTKVAWLCVRRPLAPGDVVLDIGSNDGTTLASYPTTVTAIGIDPTTEKFRAFHSPHVTAVADFFTASAFQRVAGGKKAKIITSLSMFYDLPQPLRFVEDVAEVLADDGVWHLEQSYLPSMLATGSYDTVCHEHLEYYALRQLQWMTSRAGLRITEVEFNDVNGGSFAVTVEKGREDAAIVGAVLNQEAHLAKPETWTAFAAGVARHRVELPALLRSLKAQGLRVWGLGASTKGNVLLQHCGITPDLLPAIAEVNPDKFGCFTPGTGIPIVSEDERRLARPDVLLVLPWHFKKAFLEREHAFLRAGGRLLFPLPHPELVSA